MSIYVNKYVSRFQPFAGYSKCARESVSERFSQLYNLLLFAFILFPFPVYPLFLKSLKKIN